MELFWQLIDVDHPDSAAKLGEKDALQLSEVHVGLLYRPSHEDGEFPSVKLIFDVLDVGVKMDVLRCGPNFPQCRIFAVALILERAEVFLRRGTEYLWEVHVIASVLGDPSDDSDILPAVPLYHDDVVQEEMNTRKKLC